MNIKEKIIIVKIREDNNEKEKTKWLKRNTQVIPCKQSYK